MYKQIIIVRKDLGNVSTGKIAAQCCHASMAFLTWMIRDHVIGEVYRHPDDCQKFMEPANLYRIESFDIDKDLYEQWIDGEFTKIVLQARNKSHLLKAKTMAEEMGMVEGKDFYLIKDSCRTELEPEEIDENGVGRTLTCIGFRPMDSEIIDKIGRKYHLYV
jgi:PTH2 family peptidyl-tRNA hydrolase